MIGGLLVKCNVALRKNVMNLLLFYSFHLKNEKALNKSWLKFFCSHRRTVRVIGDVASVPMLSFQFLAWAPVGDGAQLPCRVDGYFAGHVVADPNTSLLFCYFTDYNIKQFARTIYPKSFNAFSNRGHLEPIDYRSWVTGPPEINSSQDYISFCEITYDLVSADGWMGGFLS